MGHVSSESSPPQPFLYMVKAIRPHNLMDDGPDDSRYNAHGLE